MKSILIFRSAALGDFVIATPAMNEVKKRYPDRKIVLLTIKSANKKQSEKVNSYAGSVHSVPWVSLVTPHLIDDVFVIKNILSIRHLLDLRVKLKRYNFKMSILMLDPCSPWVGRIKKILLLLFLLGFKPIFGWRGLGSINGNRKKLNEKGLLKHHVLGPLQFSSEIDKSDKYSEKDLFFDLRPGKEAEKWIDKWIESNCIKNKRIVCVAPGSIQPHKAWPLDSYQILISLILESYDVVIVIIGTPKDGHLANSILSHQSKDIYNLAGFASIAQSASLLSKSQLLIGNDGGAMHLGDAMDCKVISITPGIEYPDSIEPWNNKKLSLRKKIKCSPCYSFNFCPEGHNKCMMDISVNEVFAKCQTVLE